jgi:anti-sigma-K factor RsiG
MTLARLRTYRRTLLDEELRASYWRRLVQGRRDLLRADSRPGDHAGLKQALAEERATSGRQVILMLHPDGGMPILPKLPELWASGIDELDESGRAELFARLANAENVLSSYRQALHQRLDRATADLVARYHDDPRECLVAIPSYPDPR